MRMMKIQILLAVVLFGSPVIMQGMGQYTRATYAAGRGLGVRGTVKLPKREYSIGNMPKQKEQESTEAEATTESGWGKFANWLSSFSPSEKDGEEAKSLTFEQIEETPEETRALTPEELFGIKIQQLLAGHRDDWIAPNGSSYYKIIFDENDLERAKQEIGKMIEETPACREYIIENYRAYGFSTYSLFGRGHKKRGTMLDEVLYEIFGGDRIAYITPSENALYYLELAQFLIDQGVKTNPDNEESYRNWYQNLVNSYETLKNKRPGFVYYGDEYELEIFKKIFEKLDSIVEQAVPGLVMMVEEARQGRERHEKYAKIHKQIRARVNYDIFLQQKKEFEKEHSSYKFRFHIRTLYEVWMLRGQNPDFFKEEYGEQPEKVDETSFGPIEFR